MEQITLRDLLNATKGRLAGSFSNLEQPVTGALSDNRKIEGGEVFFAYIGEKIDAHRFVPAALEAGAAGVVVSQIPEELRDDKFYCVVEDTMLAAGDLARWYRAQFNIPVLAITGSVGKTTTKEMTAAVMARHFNTLKTEGNLNNNIGLPRTLLRLNHEIEAAVVEMGMNHRGEISYLTGIGRPTTAIITNIGEAHIGNLGSKENIFKAKCEIFEGLQPGGAAILNGDDEYLITLRNHPEQVPNSPKLIYVGEAPDCDYQAVNIHDEYADHLEFTARTPQGEYEVTVPAPGRHLIYAALTAMAAGFLHGVPAQEILDGIRDFQSARMRMEIRQLPGGIQLINDTYNANPQSMKSALNALSHLEAGSRIAVLGDMFELGELEEELHRGVGRHAASLNLNALVAVGKAAAAYLADEAEKSGMQQVYRCADKEEAKEVLRNLVKPGSAFLCKASRGMALEELSAFITDQAGSVSGS
ncbi:MAG: UDP-N-acetylmuramoyl-tripeptide--D-alanyl-D-alanine ligase [Lachnospiraceae bacterium]|nr:UDP-N-acetylmuramoyl-tripeptide--D-alanyl-D-alanine ligase [Lachnospiraceae bacterium]